MTCDLDVVAKKLDTLISGMKISEANKVKLFGKAYEAAKLLVPSKQTIVDQIITVNKGKPAAKHTAKEVKKAEQATQYVGFGSTNSSTHRYMKVYGKDANTGEYTAKDVVWVSSNGKRGGRVNPVQNGKLVNGYQILDTAIEAGAMIVMDTEAHIDKTSGYNIGEVALAEYMVNKGYARDNKSGAGVWTKIATGSSAKTGSTNIYAGTNENASLSNFSIRPFEIDGET